MNPYIQVKMIADQHRADLLKEAENYRYVNAAFRDRTPGPSRIAKSLAFVGKQLGAIGHSLELRYDSQSEPRPPLNTQSNPGGCT